jgi:hypothetical protein
MTWSILDVWKQQDSRRTFVVQKMVAPEKFRIGKPSVNWFLQKLSLSLLLVLPSHSLAQVSPSTGAIQGTIMDQTGAVLPGAAVKLTNQSLGLTRRSLTQGEGTFLFPLVPPGGGYDVTVEAKGFQRHVLTGLTVRVTEVTVANARLQLGSTNEEISVHADAQVIQTTNPTLGAVMTSEVIVSLPLATRSVFDLLATDAGVAATLTSPANTITQSQQAVFVAGSRATANNYMLNGVDANNFEFHTLAAGIVPVPNPDSVMEFRTQTSLYDVTTGFSSGGNISVVTRAGTSQVHGSAYEFYRDTVFNAEDFFLNRAGAEKPVFQQNQYGFSLGGPMKIVPKTFCFVNYEGFRQKNGVQGSVTGLLPVLPADRSATNLGATFGLPPSAIDPVAVRYLNAPGAYGGRLWASGTGAPAGQLGFFAFSSPVVYNSDQFNSRLDHDFSQKNHVFGTFFWSSGALDNPSGANNALGQEYQYIFSNNSASINDTHIFRSNLLNELTYGVTWNARDISPVNNLTLSDVGMTRFNSSVINQLPDLFFPDQLTCCGGTVTINQTQHNASFDARDMISYTQGKHSVRAGFEARQQQFNSNVPPGRGTLSFSGYNADLLYGAPHAGAAGLSIRDFLIGAPIFVSDNSGLTNFGYRAHDYIAFVHDDFRMLRRLTLNLGLRYDYLGNNYEVHNFISNFDPSLLSPDTVLFGGSGLRNGFIAPEGASGGAGTAGVSPSTLVNGPGKNFAPRAGFAFDVLGSGKLAIRGGYGLYHQRIGGGSTLQSRGNPPYALGATNSGNLGTQILSNPFPTLPLPNQFPIFPSFPILTGLNADGMPNYNGTLLSVTALERNMKSPYTESWNLTIANRFRPGWTVETGYLGSHGLHLLATQSFNNALLVNTNNPARFGLATNSWANRNARVPFAGFSTGGIGAITDGAKSFYDAFLLTLTHRFAKGLYFKAAYTFSKTIDNSLTNTGFDVGGTTAGNQFFPDLNKGLADFDIRHRLVVTYVYELPRVRQRYLNPFLSNWKLSGITILQSGLPGQITQIISNSLSGTNGYGLVLTGCQLVTAGVPKDHLNSYLNASCVSLTRQLAAGQKFGPLSPYESPGNQTYAITTGGDGRLQGPVTRGFFRAPFQRRWDASLTKRFPLRMLNKRTNLEFRVEAFKVFNTPIFLGPASTVGTTTFGRITNTWDNTGRQMQFAVKLLL